MEDTQIAEQQEEQDTEVQDVCEELTGTIEAARDVLLERRDRQYADAIAPLESEQAQLRQEHARIGQAAQALAELLPARARTAQAEHDRLLLAGDREGAAAKLAEQKEAEAAPGAMHQRQREILARIDALDREKQAAASSIFESWLTECQAVVRSVERGLFCELLNGIESSVFAFQAQTGTQLVDAMHNIFNRLTADERSEEWKSGHKWYGGRTR